MAEKRATAVAPASGIKIAVHGKYYYKTETAKGTKDYSLTVRAASLEMFRESSQKYMGTDDAGRAKYRSTSYLNIRGQLKKRLLPILLGRKYVDFARVRYVIIDSVVSEAGGRLDLPIDLRSKAQLEAMIREEKIPIAVEEYLEIDDLRQDILQYIQEPEVFLKAQPAKARRRAEDKSFLELNDLNDEETLPPVREKKEKPSAGGILDE